MSNTGIGECIPAALAVGGRLQTMAFHHSTCSGCGATLLTAWCMVGTPPPAAPAAPPAPPPPHVTKLHYLNQPNLLYVSDTNAYEIQCISYT